MITIGIDIGGSSIKAALTDVGKTVIARTVKPTNAEGGPEAVLNVIDECITGLCAGAPDAKPAAIGVGVPGAIDLENGIVYHPPNLPGWKAVPLAQLIGSRRDLPVRLDNDANCAALGEAWFGAGREHDHFIGLTLGTGVGSGIIIGGAVYHGARGFAGEFGHLSIDHNGPLCKCGSRGCIEAYIGIHYLMSRAIPVLRDHPESLLQQQAVADPQGLSPKDLATAATQGDEIARSLLEDAGRYLGFAVASAANLLGITTFIIGGGISAAGDLILDSVRESAMERTLKVHRENIVILPSELGNDAGMLGAASLFMK